eukprot:2783850-Lingulodinium_polyedra.AAC.1
MRGNVAAGHLTGPSRSLNHQDRCWRFAEKRALSTAHANHGERHGGHAVKLRTSKPQLFRSRGESNKMGRTRPQTLHIP